MAERCRWGTCGADATHGIYRARVPGGRNPWRGIRQNATCFRRVRYCRWHAQVVCQLLREHEERR